MNVVVPKPPKTRLWANTGWFISVALLSSLPYCGRDPYSDTSTTASERSGATDRSANNAGVRYDFDRQPTVNRPFRGSDQIQTAIRADLEKIANNDRFQTRYLTLTHLANGGVPDEELDYHRVAIAKLVNSLTYASEIHLPEAIDAEKTIYRINLRALRWNRNTWDFIARRSPFEILANSAEERAIQQATGSFRSFLRADWFASVTSQPPLYHFLLNIPGNLRNLEFSLGVDSDRDIRAGEVIRVGFTHSNVSQHNRLLERHESRFGGYWKSYDFQSPVNNRRANLFGSPLRGGRFGGFDHAGGEVIFALPNGFQGYVLVNDRDQRIDLGPIDIVSDPRRPDRTVVNGLSCMSCHVRGMQTAKDEVREHVRANADSFNDFEVQNVLNLYGEQPAIEGAYQKDLDRFAAAIGKIGYDVSKAEPISILVERFEHEVNGKQAAAELGLNETDLSQLIRNSDFLNRELGQLLTGGQVKREIFENQFFNLVRAGQLGRTFGRQ